MWKEGEQASEELSQKEEWVHKEEHMQKEAGLFVWRLVWPKDDYVVQ